MKKKKILLFSDDLRMSSGVGTMSREIVLGPAPHFDWVQVGGAIKHPEEGQMFDLSEDVNKDKGIDNASVKVFPVNGYGNPEILKYLVLFISVSRNTSFSLRFNTWLNNSGISLINIYKIFYERYLYV